jgi:hypothetical protein
MSRVSCGEAVTVRAVMVKPGNGQLWTERGLIRGRDVSTAVVLRRGIAGAISQSKVSGRQPGKSWRKFKKRAGESPLEIFGEDDAARSSRGILVSQCGEVGACCKKRTWHKGGVFLIARARLLLQG